MFTYTIMQIFFNKLLLNSISKSKIEFQVDFDAWKYDYHKFKAPNITSYNISI